MSRGLYIIDALCIMIICNSLVELLLTALRHMN